VFPSPDRFETGFYPGWVKAEIWGITFWRGEVLKVPRMSRQIGMDSVSVWRGVAPRPHRTTMQWLSSAGEAYDDHVI